MAKVSAAEIRGAYARVLVQRGYGSYPWSQSELDSMTVVNLRALAGDIGIERGVVRNATKAALVAEIRRYAEIVERAR